MLSSIPLVLTLALLAHAQTHLPLTRRNRFSKVKETSDYKELRDFTISKYSKAHLSRRQRVEGVPLTNFGFDTTYYAPATVRGNSFNLILDTGSSDTWIASSECDGCGGVPAYTPQSSGPTIQLQYGSGAAEGIAVTESMDFGGFTQDQTFVAVQQVSRGLLQGSISGLMGLGFRAIAQTNSTPFVERLVDSDQLSNPEMSFYLQRQIDNGNVGRDSPGGVFTIGGTNTSLYQGDIDFVDFPSGVRPSFWLLPVTSVGVQGTNLNVASGRRSFAAIDTGTTLIGGPTAAVASVYEAIPGSRRMTGDMDGYWSIPCNTQVFTSFTFSSRTWNIAPVDFTVQQLSGGQCLGAIFGTDIGSRGGPDWVIGDAFLKNVYTVFRFDPPSIGFAQLASNLQDPQATAGAPSGSNSIIMPTGGVGGGSPTGSAGNPFESSGSMLQAKSLGAASMIILASILTTLHLL